MLSTKQLTKTFSRQKHDFDAVHSVDFELKPGDFCVLTGPSGCGKSTFFHMVCGITKPDSGEIYFNGKNVTELSQKEWAKMRATDISYILQGDSLLPNFSVIENICLPHLLSDKTLNLRDKAMELLKEFGLENMADEYPANLSGGERRRVAIVRAFVHDPVLIVADEPTSDLDEENTAMILDYFVRQAKAGKAILISTHDLSFITDDMTHYVMKKGVMEKI